MSASRDGYRRGRLTASHSSNQHAPQQPLGAQPLQLDGRTYGQIYVPRGYKGNVPAALALMLHGAGGQAEQGLSLIKKYADAYNIILVAPASKAYTWDVIAADSFGADVILIDQTLAAVFSQFNIDGARIAIGGFSDGASYALSIGLGNGDLFSHIIAFSPGFYHTLQPVGKPNVFIAHGVHDNVLPINPCSRRMVPRLQNSGIAVKYLEFNGAHEIPPDISKAAVVWFTRS